jgi:hypothetical protein
MATTYNCGPTCTITCPDGGGCVYSKTSGRCTKWCNDARGRLVADRGNGPLELTADTLLTVNFDNVTVAQLARVLQEIGLYKAARRRGKAK